jgi:hypothetical protein
MAALTTITAARAGVSVVGAAAAGGGDTFTNTGGEVAIVFNGDGSPITVTFTTSVTVDGLAVADRAVTVGASARLAIGPFPKYAYGSTVSIAYSAVTSVTVAILKVTPETT